MKRSQLKQIIREEIQNLLSEEQRVDEGIFKNLALAALLALPGISSAQAQAVKNPDKIVNVVTADNAKLQFKDFESFHNHFVKNINDFKNLRGERKFTVVIDGVVYEGVVGMPSRDMQMALDKIPFRGVSHRYQNIHKDNNVYIGYKLFKTQ